MAEPHLTAESGVDLRHYLDVVRRRKWIIVGVTAAALLAASLYTVLETPTFEARTTIVVGQGGGIVQPQNANAIQPFSATMQELLTSSIVATKVIGRLGLDLTPEQLLRKVSVSFNPESAALQVSVVDTSARRARRIAASIGSVFSKIVSTRLGRLQPGSTPGTTTPGLTATIWDPAHVVPGKVSPKPLQNLLVAGVLGIVLGLLAAFLREYLDRRLRSVEEIERAFGAPVIGRIPAVGTEPEPSGDTENGAQGLVRVALEYVGARPPRASRDVGRGRAAGDDRSTQPELAFYESDGHFAEAFRVLRANLHYLAVDKPLRTILVTSVSAGQGKTTVCANLSRALAQAGASVALLEADLRRPQLSRIFGLPVGLNGLTNVIVRRAKLSETMRTVVGRASGESSTAAHSVSLLPSGPLPPNPSELLASPAMADVLSQLGSRFDFVVVDSAPILLVSDAVELAHVVDGVILVVRAEDATSDEAKDLVGLVDRLGINLVGVVVTGVKTRSGYDSYYSGQPVELPAPPKRGRPVRAVGGPKRDGGEKASAAQRNR
jgi:tyrosine-protein kinase